MPRLTMISAAVASLQLANGAFVGQPMGASAACGSVTSAAASPMCGWSTRSSRVDMITAADFAIAVPGKFSRDERLKSRYGGFAFEPEGGWGGDGIDSFGYDELQSSMREIATFSRGDSVQGTIIGFEPNGALVEIGVKSSAYCSLQEMALVKPNKPEQALEVGATYDFVIVSREDENGQLMLSRRRILFSQAWDRVAQLYADDASVEGEVSAVNRGGAMMLVEGLRAFLPGSHFLAGQTPTEEFIGRKLEVKFLDVDKDTSRLVVSHRKAVVDTQIHDLNVGSVLKGVVTAVKPYGAFVDIGGMSGLLHISQISCDHISNVDSVIPVGTTIKCMVISQDKGKGRIALSTKTLEQDPGDMIKNQQKVFDNAEDTAAKYQERIAAERKAREEAAQDVIFGLESVFTDSEPAAEGGDAAPAAEPAAAAEGDLPFEA